METGDLIAELGRNETRGVPHVSLNGNHFCYVEDGRFYSRLMATGEIRFSMEIQDRFDVRRTSTWNGGDILAVKEGTGIIQLYDLAVGLQKGEVNCGGVATRLALAANGERMAVIRDPDRVHMYSCRRPEYWWGVAWLWEFWATLGFGCFLVWSLWRDRRMFAGFKDSGQALIPE